MLKLCLIVVGVVVSGLIVTVGIAGMFRREGPPQGRDQLEALIKAGNFKDAYEGFRKLALNPNEDAKLVGNDLRRAIFCLYRLGRVDEIDALRDAAIEIQKGRGWRFLHAAAESLLAGEQHFGFMIAGKFQRGQHRGGGRMVGSVERDRVRALQLLAQGINSARDDGDKTAVGEYFLTLAHALMANREPGESWRLQSVTPLDSLPDYEDNPRQFMGFNGDQAAGAPVDADGNPVYHHVPTSFDAAKSDGERWRWSLAQAAEQDPARLNLTRFELAMFCVDQFGTRTLDESFLPREGDGKPAAFALETLKEDETIARLANGVKRFTLPDEFNFITINRTIADDPKTGHGEDALGQLAAIFQNRRQYDRAVEFLKRSLATYGDNERAKQGRIDQIINNWGEFESNPTQAAGRGGSIDYRFRNGRHVRFEARAIDVPKLLNDIKAYLKSSPNQLDWRNVQLGDIGNRLVNGDGAKYLGRSVAAWDLALDPAKGHFDKTVTVTTPLQNAGAYLVTATMEGGNISRIILWLDDTVIVKKPLENKTYYFVADARNGRPVANAEVDIFGWRSVQVGNANRFKVETRAETARTDAEGQLLVPIGDNAERNYQWLITARDTQGRFAHLGFENVWNWGQTRDSTYNAVRVYTITDRPVYRPGSPVKFKFWVARSRYDEPEKSEFAGQEFPVEIRNPKGDKVHEQTLRADAHGGFDGTFELPSDATLGVYQVFIPKRGGGSFRVEEYKKPEFEVTVEAPKKPVMLGEKITATIEAKYLFGAPVSQAKVKYKVTRKEATERWFPVARWDWLYGGGYWWFASDYAWYPGWSSWGMIRPLPWWFSGSNAPPEVIADAEAAIQPDGTLKITIDTALALAVHPDQDQRYEITAEVTDQSRRTIVGAGTVLVARKPFSVHAWVDRGHYRAGDTIHAEISAQTLDHRPVQGEGKLELRKISYDAQRRPVETPVQTWGVTMTDAGRFQQTIKAAAPGQYRLVANISDGEGHAIEGGYLLTISGPGFDGGDFRFNDLEIIPDQKDYRPGDKVRLMINANQPGATVLLFTRPSNGVYLPPKVIHLRGKSTVEEIEIAQRDMPNIFIEALTIAAGKVHDEARSIAVPPESRVVSVEVKPSQATYKPGQKARVELKLTGPDGKPFVGSTVVSVYDKAVEAISGGSNVPEIKAFFWKWVRTHQPMTRSSLDGHFNNIMKPNEIGMQPLGEPDEIAHMRFRMGGGMGGMGGMGGGMMGMMEGTAGRAASPRMMMMRGAAMKSAEDPAPAPAGAAVDRKMAIGLGAQMIPAEGFEVEKAKSDAGGAAVEPVVRTNFADTAFWAAAITTNAEGAAVVDFDLPESLTTWKVKTWALGPGTRVGQAEAEVITTKDLLVRLQAPRFFVQKDEVVLSAIVHSKLKEKKSVQVLLEFDGSVLEPLDATARTIELAAGGEQRVDWRVKVAHEGQAVIRMKALTNEESDAAQMTFPAYVHGMLKLEALAGAIRPDAAKAELTVTVPAERRPEQTRLEVRYSPTLAGAMVDALPYLADYPYACTEQTLNRFLPTVITQNVLMRMGLDLAAIRDKRTNLNAQELGDAQERAKGWKRFEHNAVFDEAEVAKMARAGIDHLADMQLSNGGWGWFSGFGEHASPHTTAVVVHGLHIARQNDLTLPEGMLERGVAWLTEYQKEQTRMLQNASGKTRPYRDKANDLDALVFMVLNEAQVRDEAMFGFLDRDRVELSVYGKTLYGLALVKLDQPAKLAEVMKNISQYVVQDDENQTAYLKLPNQGFWWFWYGSETESHAFYLKLLAHTEPKGELAARLVKYMLNNRKHATYWESTRDTAYCIEAMADFLKNSGEDRPDMTVRLAVDGRERKQVKITPADLFTFDNALVLEGPALDSGKHTITLSREGKGPVYFNAYLTNFTLEDPIKKAGLEIKLDRKVYRLVRDDKTIDAAGGRGQVVGQRAERYKRVPLADEAVLKSGDLVEVELEIESKNDYEYLVFEDFKAAGFEPVEVRSGYNGNDLGAYVEFRDERVAFFARALARGRHSVSYRLRAEIPGRFHALPARAAAMYAPELKANSDEVRLKIQD